MRLQDRPTRGTRLIDKNKIPFHRTPVTGDEYGYIREAIESRQLSGPGKQSKACESLIKSQIGAERVFLVPSCTAALEMSALLLGLGPGDEVIMPSFTFVSNPNAVVLRGATPVFVDVDPVTFNIDPQAVEQAITDRTRAIFATHYAGVPADMEALQRIAEPRGIVLVEDAAQAYGSRRNGKPAGMMAPLAGFSFHGTKNVAGGEAGALVVNDRELAARAAIIREKGTDRSRFLDGEVDFYTWQDVGSSQLVSEVTAAFLRAQLEHADQLNAERLELWERYRSALSELGARGYFRLPSPPASVEHNAHIFFLVLSNREERDTLASVLAARGISAYWHYIPLHSSPGGQRYGRTVGSMAQTHRAADCLIRLPLFQGLGAQQDQVIEAVRVWAENKVPA